MGGGQTQQEQRAAGDHHGRHHHHHGHHLGTIRRNSLQKVNFFAVFRWIMGFVFRSHSAVCPVSPPAFGLVQFSSADSASCLFSPSLSLFQSPFQVLNIQCDLYNILPGSEEFSWQIHSSSCEGRPSSPLTSETGQKRHTGAQRPKNRDRKGEDFRNGQDWNMCTSARDAPARTHAHTHTHTHTHTEHCLRYI